MYFTHTFRAFRHRDYFIFWCGLFLGHTGTLAQMTAQGCSFSPQVSAHPSFFFAGSRHLFPSLLFLFNAGGFQTTFLSAIATLLQIHTDETNRGRIMSLFGLINRGLGPMGSFPSV